MRAGVCRSTCLARPCKARKAASRAPHFTRRLRGPGSAAAAAWSVAAVHRQLLAHELEDLAVGLRRRGGFARRPAFMSLRAWRTRARSCCSVGGGVVCDPAAQRVVVGDQVGRASARPRAAAAVSAAGALMLLGQRRRCTASSASGSSLRISLPMNCIWRRLPSKLVMRLASASASTSFSVELRGARTGRRAA